MGAAIPEQGAVNAIPKAIARRLMLGEETLAEYLLVEIEGRHKLTCVDDNK